MERFEDRLTLDKLRLVERYIESETHMLLRFRLGHGQDYIASPHRIADDMRPSERPAKIGDWRPRIASDPILREVLARRWK